MMFRNVRKGFTFVELAIVLVIIGIIMGMALKGRSLIEGAKTRSEIRKIERIQAALSTWVANAGANSTPREFEKLTPVKSCAGADNGSAAWNQIVVNGAACLDIDKLDTLSEGDKINPYGHRWVLVGGEWAGKGTDNASKIGYGTSFYTASSSAPRFACNVDSILDDKYFLFGEVRSNMQEVRTDTNTPKAALKAQDKNDKPFTTCDKWDNLIVSNNYFVAYNLGL
jgi:prepilin-type N-terminal cleavage/methylation domain-containing protein